jgi:hypothetical protein
VAWNPDSLGRFMEDHAGEEVEFIYRPGGGREPTRSPIRIERRRGMRRWDDVARGPGLMPFVMGVAYGIVLTVVVYTWLIPR